jgi:hypothetical protein
MWPISSCKKVRKCCNPHVYWWNRIGFKQSHFVEDLVATPRCMFLVSLFWRWDVVSLTLLHIRSFFIGNLLIYLYSKVWTSYYCKRGVSLSEVTHSSSFHWPNVLRFLHYGFDHNTQNKFEYCLLFIL